MYQYSCISGYYPVLILFWLLQACIHPVFSLHSVSTQPVISLYLTYIDTESYICPTCFQPIYILYTALIGHLFIFYQTITHRCILWHKGYFFPPTHIFVHLFVRSLIHSIWAIAGPYSTKLHHIIHHYTILCQ